MDLQFDKYADGLVPAIVQDAKTNRVLMLGFVNAAALAKTLESGLVTFFSRTRGRLWTKGETSGNHLKLVEVLPDCDRDTILIKAVPSGNVCHTGAATCFDESNVEESVADVLKELESVIEKRHTFPAEGSYTAELFSKGINRIAQKVGEEAVELIIEAKDANTDAFKSEAADLLYHLLVLLRAKDVKLDEVLMVLKDRQK